MYEDDFCERLSYLREKKGISAREMSLSIGQNASYINRIENKKSFPSMQGFFYICEYLQVSPKDFFDTQNPEPSCIAEIVTVLKKLSPAQLEIVLSVVQQFKPR